MFQRINVYQFRDAFRSMGRDDQFSYEGLEVLFDYLEDLEQDTGEPVELDVIGLCCEFVEMDMNEVVDQYDLDVSECYDVESIEQLVEDFLGDNTMVCGRTKSGAFVFGQF